TMADKPIKPLSGNTSIADWLDHPTGGPLIPALLAQGGQTPEALKPVRRLALKRLVPMSKGAFPPEMIDDLARKANEPAGLGADAVADDAADDDVSADAAAPEWVEKVTPGRF